MTELQHWHEREFRSVVHVRVSVMGQSGQELPAVITNLSTRGCHLRSDGPLDLGERIRIVIPNLGRVLALVRWSRAGDAGAQFVAGSDVWIVPEAKSQPAPFTQSDAGP